MNQITIKKQRLARALSAVLVAASDDLSRPHLAQVQVWSEDDRLNLATTNGHWACLWTDVLGDSFGSVKIGISRRDAEFLAAVLRLDRPDDAEEAEGEEIELCLGTGIEIECDRWTVRLSDTHLQDSAPDLDRLIKGTRRGSVPCIELSSTIVADVRKAFKVCGNLAKDAEHMEFGFGPSILDPVLVTSSSVPELAAIVMPRTPVDVEVTEVDGERRYARKDTGEVIHSEQVSKQTCIAGTEPDPVKQSINALQDLADKDGVTMTISSGDKSVEIKPRKRAKKQAAEVTP